MNNQIARRQELPVEALKIPEYVISRDGTRVDLTSTIWRFSAKAEGGSTISLNFGLWGNRLAPRAEAQAKLHLVHLLETRAAWTVRNVFEMFGRLLNWWAADKGGSRLDWSHIDEADFRAFLAHGMRSSDAGNDFSRLRSFYRWGTVVKEWPEFRHNLLRVVESIRASGNEKGRSVDSWDPVQGPFDQDEIDAIVAKLNAAHGTPEQRVVVRLLLDLGVRPLALSLLRNQHLKRHSAKIVLANGTSGERIDYHLKIPKLKGRTAQIVKWKWRPISIEAGDWLWALPREETEGYLLPWLRTVRRPEMKVAAQLKQWARSAGLRSHRTGEIMNLAPRRFRYTLATHMAIEGASREQIAEALDHTDLQNVEIYIQAAANFMNDVTPAVDHALTPLVRRFLGKVVDRDNPEPFEGIPKRVVPGSAPFLPVLNQPIGSIGVCGRDIRKDGLCRLAPPLSCYLCDRFAAFIDAPHARVADQLEKMVLMKANTTSDQRIPLQVESVLKAIAQLRAQIAAEAESEGDA